MMVETVKKTEEARFRGKRAVAAVTVAVVFVIAGVGFFVWHEQPSFCNAVCHTPMDPYLVTYEADPADEGVDKYGNTVEASTMLAAVHRVDGGMTCLDCHEPTILQQIGEGIAWITGGYVVEENSTYGAILRERSLSELSEVRGESYEQFCLNEECHNVLSVDGLGKMTSMMPRNVHDSSNAPHGQIAECGDCHKAHTQSVVLCSKCHDDAEVPEGWLSWDEYESRISAS